MSEDLEGLVEKARSGDPEARKALVEKASLRIARVAMGESAKDKYDSLREIERGEGAAPGLGVLLAGIAREEDLELRRAIESVIRAGTRRWGPPERAAIAAIVKRHGARLNAELAIDTLEWIVEFPEDETVDAIVRGVAPALAAASAEQFERFGWSKGFQAFVMRERELVLKWSAQLSSAKQVAKALFNAQSHGRDVTAALEWIWIGAPCPPGEAMKRDVWAAAVHETVRGNYGMSGREAIVEWSWRRFCTHETERTALYAAFEPWRDLWIEQRNKMPARGRPGGESATAHLRLWGGLAVEHLSAVVEEIERLARDDEWPTLVDVTFDLGCAATQEWRRHGLAGVCRIAGKVCNRIREGEMGPGIQAAGDRVISRAEALVRELRESGAVLDEIVANRANDLETEARLIREKRERDAEHRARDAERAVALAERAADQARMALEVEEAKRKADAARIAAEDMRARADAEMRARLAASLPRFMPQPIDEEVFFHALPTPTLISYARMFKRLTQGQDAMQSLAADGVSLEMIAVINQTWGSLFSQRPELALRFSVLISSQLG